VDLRTGGFDYIGVLIVIGHIDEQNKKYKQGKNNPH